jgi:hypothetical protein
MDSRSKRIGAILNDVRRVMARKGDNTDINLSRLNYSRRCAEASAVQAYQKCGYPLAPGTEIGYVVTDADKWDVYPERDAS